MTEFPYLSPEMLAILLYYRNINIYFLEATENKYFHSNFQIFGIIEEYMQR